MTDTNEDHEKISQLAHAYEIILCYATTQFYPGRAEYDVKQPLQIAMRVLKTFLFQLLPRQRELFLNTILADLHDMKNQCS